MDATISKTERWEAKHRLAGTQFAEIQTYDKFYAKVAILSINKDRIIVEYPTLAYPKRALLKTNNPCAIFGTFDVYFKTDSIRNDVDVKIRELL